MDANKHGTITLGELKSVLQTHYAITDDETLSIFNALDSNNDEEIHYSDFLAAMVNTRIQLHDDLITQAFKKFDVDNSGYITKENLTEIMAGSNDLEQVEKFIAEADLVKDGRISLDEFKTYMRGDPTIPRQTSPSTPSGVGCFAASQPLKRPTWGRRSSQQNKPDENADGS